jgi:hypothetical protein
MNLITLTSIDKREVDFNPDQITYILASKIEGTGAYVQTTGSEKVIPVIETREQIRALLTNVSKEKQSV